MVTSAAEGEERVGGGLNFFFNRMAKEVLTNGIFEQRPDGSYFYITKSS